MTDFADAKLMFRIIKEKLNDIQDDINYIMNHVYDSKDNIRSASFLLKLLANLEAEIIGARNTATTGLNHIWKGEKHGLFR